MNSLVKFRPTNEHLLAHYLQQKATGVSLPPGLIEECNLYSQEPWRIFDTTLEQTFYIFTTLRKNKSRVLRTAGSGTWKEQHVMKIPDILGEWVGYKKSFKFQGGRSSSATSGGWIMYEFSMCDERWMELNPPLPKPLAAASHMPNNFRCNDAIADLLAPMATVTVQGSNNDWIEGWMTTELDSVVHSLWMRMRWQNICDPTSPAFGSNITLNWLLTTGGTEVRYASYSPSFGCNRDANVPPTLVDTSNTTYPAFDDGAYADLLPMTAEKVNDDNEWIDRLTDMDIDPVVDADYLFGSNSYANPS
ncbi:NAC domain-containing protein 14-like [Eucalyptus grandis]|uniref:NAC domain-containing protein 14-like n=1 Tax=Eucalyptus grandis TaxID=71139 RepID=UPI00192EAB77|nr:NAC domain-containing protein 14-like [Eucalyptus grandis]